jgi:rhodanese-related sulfurtransferase
MSPGFNRRARGRELAIHWYFVLTVSLALSLAISACSAAQEKTPEDLLVQGQAFPVNADGYADITVDQLAGILDQKEFSLINVHIPYEGEIAQTDRFIPYNEISQHLDELGSQDSPIVLYCRSGNMSTTAAKELVELGYTKIFEVDGGFNAWKVSGRELIERSP